MLNGLCLVESGSDYLLPADSTRGVVWRVDMSTSTYEIAFNDTTTQPANGQVGIDGVHTREGYLYYTNLASGFYRVPIFEDGTQAGAVEILASLVDADGFTFDECGNAYIIALGADDQISKFTAGGSVETLSFANTDANVLLEGNTAMKFGRRDEDCGVLYVVTNGGLSGLVNGTWIQGGRVLSIDLLSD